VLVLVRLLLVRLLLVRLLLVRLLQGHLLQGLRSLRTVAQQGQLSHLWAERRKTQSLQVQQTQSRVQQEQRRNLL
jgi:hypothetical protein